MASSLFIEFLQSGATPWAIIILVTILAIMNIATCLLRMDPDLVDAFTRRKVIGRMLRRRSRITPQQAQEVLRLLLEQPSQEDQAPSGES